MPAHSPTPSPGVSGWGSGSWQAKLLEKLPENMRCKLIQVPPGGSHTTCYMYMSRAGGPHDQPVEGMARRLPRPEALRAARRRLRVWCTSVLYLHSAISGGCSLGRWCTAHDCRAGNVSDAKANGLRRSTLGFGEHPTHFPTESLRPYIVCYTAMSLMSVYSCVR